MPLRKIVHRAKNGSLIEKAVTHLETGSQFEKLLTLGKMEQEPTQKNGSHLEKWVTL